MKPSLPKYFQIALVFGVMLGGNTYAGQPLEIEFRGGLRHVSENSIVDNGKSLYLAGSVYTRVSEKSWVGIDFTYWQNGVHVLPDNVGSIYAYILKIYRAGAGYKYRLYSNNNPREPISVLIGGRLDYHRGYIEQSMNENMLSRVQYDNLGMAMTAEARYSIFSLWGELALARLHGGDRHGEPNNYWGPPTINLISAAYGLALVFRI